MKKILSLLLAATLCLGLLAGCGGTAKPTYTSAELAEVLKGARTDDQNEYFPIITSSEDNGGAMQMDTLGLAEEDLDAFACSVSLMIVQAYAQGIFVPAQGREDAVKAALEGFVAGRVQSFENYLPLQHELAKSAKLEVLDSGVIVLTICEDSDAAHEAVVAALAK